MGVWTALKLLLWKNITYRRRSKIQLVIELLWPLFLFVILISVRHSHPPYKQTQCHFPNKALPSAGTLNWVQGIICNINNPCFHHTTPGETPGRVGNFDYSILSRLFIDSRTILSYSANQSVFSGFQEILSAVQKLGERPDAWPNMPVREYLRANETFSSFLLVNGSLPPTALDQLMKAQLNFQLSLAGAGLPLKEIVCNASLLGQYLTVGQQESLSELQLALCAVPSDILQAAEQIFLSQLDYSKLFTRDRLLSSAAELQVLSNAIASVSAEAAQLMDN
ncbi:hypothetical protein Z043_122719, partial [Scleropages formosus]